MQCLNQIVFVSVVQEVQKHSSHTLVFRSLKRTHDMFLSEQLNPPPRDETAYVKSLFLVLVCISECV